MKRFFSESNIHIFVCAMLAVVFGWQSWMYLSFRFENVAKIFAKQPKIQAYVYDALEQLWLDMLMWPLLFFLVLLLTILRLKKAGS